MNEDFQTLINNIAERLQPFNSITGFAIEKATDIQRSDLLKLQEDFDYLMVIGLNEKQGE